MAEKIAIEFSIGDGPAIKSMGDLKKQLKEAQFEALALSEKFGATSQEAINAAQKVAALKDAVGDAKDLVESFNPDAKFKAFSGALQGVAGGFAAVQGAMGLFGAESEDVQKTLLKVQSALALSEGLNSVMASVDAFKNLGAVMKSIPIIQKALTIGQKLWNLAMEANPIGLIILAITALIAAGTALISWFNSSSEAAEAQAESVNASTEALKNQKQALSESNKELDRNQKQQLAMAKASGMNADAIRQLELKLIDEKIAYANSSKEAANNTLEKEKNALASLKAADADDEIIKQQEENVKAAEDLSKTTNENYQSALDEKKDIQNRHLVEIQQAENDANADAQKKRDEAEQKRKEADKKAREERLAAEKKFQSDLKNLRDENYINSIKDDETRAKEKALLDFQNNLAEIQARQINENEKLLLIQENAKKYQLVIDQIDAEKKAKEEEQNAKKIEQLDKEIQDEIDRLDKLNEIDFKKKKENIEAQKKLDEEKFNNQMELASKTSGILNQFADVVGKQTAVGKALAIASATIDTYSGAMKAFRATYSPIGPVDVAMRIASVAATIAAGIKNVKAIASVKVPGGGGGGSVPSTPSMTTGGMEAPVAPALSSTALNQQMINSMNSATNRAFVLESDISGNQERIQRLNRAARIS